MSKLNILSGHNDVRDNSILLIAIHLAYNKTILRHDQFNSEIVDRISNEIKIRDFR